MVPELSRHCCARGVLRVTVDLNSIDLGQGQPGQGESVAGLRREPPAYMVNVNPVPEFQGARTEPRHQADFTQDRLFGGIEDRVYEANSRVKFSFESGESLFDGGWLGRLVKSGGNPGADMVATASERRFKERCIGRLPATEDETRSLDPLRRDPTSQLPGL